MGAKQLQDIVNGIDGVLHPAAPAGKIEGVIGEISKILSPGAKRGVLTDAANALQQLVDQINNVLHPAAPAVIKREVDIVDIAQKIEGVIGEISKLLSPGAKREID